MTPLWEDSDVQRWHDARDRYAATLASMGKVSRDKIDGDLSLVELEERLAALAAKTFPARFEARDPHLTKAELVLIMRYKLSKGKFRPLLAKLRTNNAPADVERVSRAAFALARDGDRPKAMKALGELSMVGPATASYCLSLVNPGVFPPMSDEAMAACIADKVEYTLPRYEEFATLLAAKASELSRGQAREMDATDVEKSLWVDSQSQSGGAKTARGGGAAAAKRLKR